MKLIGLILLVGFSGYLLGFVLGMLAVNLFSANHFDKATEAAMTGAFVSGPLVALLSILVFLLLRFMRR